VTPTNVPFQLMAAESDTGSDLAIELVRQHVRLVPAVGGGDALVCVSLAIDGREKGFVLAIATWPDDAYKSPQSGRKR
jgi:hypothetical protein